MSSKQPAKSHQLTVRLQPGVHKALTLVGARIGVKPAVLASMAIGDFVAKSEASYNSTFDIQDKLVAQLGEAFTEHLGALFSEEQIQKMMIDDGKNG